MKTSALLSLLALTFALPASGFARDNHSSHADYHRDHRNDFDSKHHRDFHRDNNVPLERSRGFHRYYEPSFGFGLYGSPFYSRGFYDPLYDSHPRRLGAATDTRSLSIEAHVQIALARRGFYKGAIDGVIGDGSRRAIRNYQARRGWPVTGKIDNRLLDALDIP